MINSIKTIAMYLPQFHNIVENDMWWGEGFTEWTAVKAAEKLFDTHNQKREPLDNNYYNLMDRHVMQWQADLMKKYSVDGMCFYHYYFKSGRKILEKPAENLLKWTEINMPFCFCWASEQWVRTWSNINGNSWADKFEKKDSSGRTILLEQDYGREQDWAKHYDYLSLFFRDERYIKIDNKPIFLFNNSNEIEVLEDMISCWNRLSIEQGYSGIYTIGINTIQNIRGLDAVLFQAPNAYMLPHVFGHMVLPEWINGIKAYDYDQIYKNAVVAEKPITKRTYFGAFVDYDDTPRRGTSGLCVSNVEPQKFNEYLYELAVKNMCYDNDILFINAWNEWGEGNYLEPDKKYGYSYLEAIKNMKEKCVLLDSKDKVYKEWDRIKQAYRDNEGSAGKNELVYELNKYKKFYSLLNKWLDLKGIGQNLSTYFMVKGYKDVVIYGFAELGRHLYRELKSSEINVVAIMDRKKGIICDDVELIYSDSMVPKCDAVIVTAVSDFDNIKEKLKVDESVAIISLQEVIFFEYK